jgi:hypothetical protein
VHLLSGWANCLRDEFLAFFRARSKAIADWIDLADLEPHEIAAHQLAAVDQRTALETR